MFPRILLLCRLFAASAALVAATRAGAQLSASSPFLPAQNNGPAAPTAGAPLEYRGYIETPEGVQYRIYDPARKSGEWVKLNERNANLDLVAKQHDDGRNTLTIEYQGRTLTLAEREAKVVSSGAPTQMVPAPAAPPANVMPAAVTQAVVVNPTPADEQRRLEAVAAEVARRRALREQATQQVGQGGAPQVAAPQAFQQNPAQNQQNNNPRGRGPQPQPARQQR